VKVKVEKGEQDETDPSGIASKNINMTLNEVAMINRVEAL